MYNLSEELINQYEYDITDVTKGRGAYLCHTGLGMKQLKQYDGSLERAALWYCCLEEGLARGMEVDRLRLTKEGTVLAKDVDGTHFYMKEYVSGQECEVKSKKDLLGAMEALARFHKGFHGYTPQITYEKLLELVGIQKEKQLVGDEYQEVEIYPRMKRAHLPQKDILQTYEKHTKELRNIRNYIRSKRTRNDFEQLYYNHYDMFYQQAQTITERLSRLLPTIEKQEEVYGICHGELNHHNVILTNQGYRLNNLETLCYGDYMLDVANFLRKVMEKNNWNVNLAGEMLRAYEKYRSISEAEREILFIRLSYPEKFWKVVNHYYNSRKSWISGRNIEKLEKVIAQEKQKADFLNSSLFCFVK